MTDKKIRGQNFNHFYYADERENTVQFTMPNGFYFDALFDNLDELCSRFGYIKGNLKFTIEFYPDTEDEVEDA